MKTYMVLTAKGLLPCVLVGGGVTLGQEVPKVRHAYHRVVDRIKPHRAHAKPRQTYKAAARHTEITEQCIQPLYTSPFVLEDLSGHTPSSPGTITPNSPTIYGGTTPGGFIGGGFLPGGPNGGTPPVTGTPGTNPPPVSAVPEPASWMFMLTGFTMVGTAARYQRRKAATA
jgi:hypothetical protein